MGQRLMGHSLPAEAACGNSMINMGSDESVLILIKHCQDMKQQETRLRLVTLLLLLSCMALILFFFPTGADLWQHNNSGSRGQENAVEQSPAYSKQECTADKPPTDFKRLHIHLRSKPEASTSGELYMTWDAVFGEKYDEEKRAIVIPAEGFYFVYVRIALNCLGEDESGNFKRFYMELERWNKGYDKNVTMTEASDGIVCTPEGSKTVFLGQLFDLSEGDRVRVLIKEGYELITKSSFGAYLT